jgi:hypothetical protein
MYIYPISKKVGAALGLAIGLAAATPSTPAHADPHTHDEYVVCSNLEAVTPPTTANYYSTLDTMVQVMTNQMGSKLMASTIVDAVTYVCPQYYTLVQNYTAARNPNYNPNYTGIGRTV